MFNISVNFKDTKKTDHILESLLDFQSLFDAINIIYKFLEINDDIQVVSQLSRLLGHCIIERQNKTKVLK